MWSLKTNSLLLSFAFSFLFSVSAFSAEDHHHNHGHDHQQSAHQHGVATMHLVIVENELLIELHSPLFNVIGFEHQAKTKQQQALIRKQLALVEAADLIQLDQAARCKLKDTHIHHPFSPDDKKEHHHNHTHRHDHSHHAKHGHRDLSFEYQFTCDQPSALTSINTQKLFKAWTHLETLNVEWVYHNHQSAITLNRANPVILFE